MFEFNVKLAGILNITEDSFSDGGKYIEFEKSIEHLNFLLNDSDTIDIGAISSNPAGSDVSIETEIQRLKPIIEYAIKNHISISIDTWRYEVQKFCLNYEIDFLNDITGFSNKNLYPLLRDHKTKIIVMHQIHKDRASTIKTIEPENLYFSIINFFDERLSELIKSGIDKKRIMIDPGMGFFLGNDPLNSIRVINMIPELKKRYNVPIYISVSKKSFLGKIANIEDPNERNYVTLACELALIKKGVDWIRTHNPKSIKDSLKILKLIQIY